MDLHTVEILRRVLMWSTFNSGSLKFHPSAIDFWTPSPLENLRKLDSLPNNDRQVAGFFYVF